MRAIGALVGGCPLRSVLVATACLLSLALTAGCGGSDTEPEPVVDEEPEEEPELIAVPDLVGFEGADAVVELESLGLHAALDPDRDPDGCEVSEQDPSAGDQLLDEDEVLLYLDCRQVDWENQEGEDWEAFTSGFFEGFETGCDDLFSLSPDGFLYHLDQEVTVDDCLLLEPIEPDDPPLDVPDDPDADGREQGIEAGCDAVFDDLFTFTLSWGTDSYTTEDCLATVSIRPVAGCFEDVGGQSIFLEGAIDCDQAAAIWAEYLERAPQEGEGSGGGLTVQGWFCISARPPEAPRLGSCTSPEGEEFVAYADE